jgi:hypothetical protein
MGVIQGEHLMARIHSTTKVKIMDLVLSVMSTEKYMTSSDLIQMLKNLPHKNLMRTGLSSNRLVHIMKRLIAEHQVEGSRGKGQIYHWRRLKVQDTQGD